MHEFSVYQFSDKEIDQIVALLEHRAQGSLHPVDRRRISPQVERWAIAWNVLCWGREITEYRVNGNELVKVIKPWVEHPDRLYPYTAGSFSFVHSVPVEALWRLMRPLVEDHSGYSITSDRRWRDLDLWEAGSRLHQDEMISEMFRMLAHLQMHGYVRFQAAGSIWRIDVGGWAHDQREAA